MIGPVQARFDEIRGGCASVRIVRTCHGTRYARHSCGFSSSRQGNVSLVWVTPGSEFESASTRRRHLALCIISTLNQLSPTALTLNHRRVSSSLCATTLPALPPCPPAASRYSLPSPARQCTDDGEAKRARLPTRALSSSSPPPPSSCCGLPTDPRITTTGRANLKGPRHSNETHHARRHTPRNRAVPLCSTKSHGRYPPLAHSTARTYLCSALPSDSSAVRVSNKKPLPSFDRCRAKSHPYHRLLRSPRPHTRSLACLLAYFTPSSPTSPSFVSPSSTCPTRITTVGNSTRVVTPSSLKL